MSVVIESTRYNNLVQRLSAILGNSTTGLPTNGYGQPLNIDPFGVVGSRNQTDLSNVDKIDDEQFRNLYIDLVRCRVHQIGAAAFSVDPFVVGDYNTNQTSTDKVQESYIQSLESLMTQIETDKFDIDVSSQADIESLTSNFRPQSLQGPWNETLSHIFTVSFGSAEDRRHFFNSGGEIRFSANLSYTGSQEKTLKWQQDLNAMGAVTFKATKTFSNAGEGTVSSIGNYQLTGSYQLVYRNSGINPYSGSAYEIYALQNSATQIQFRIYFADTDPETGNRIDEDVFGDLTSTVDYVKPNGSVNVNGETYNTVVFNKPVLVNTVSSLI